MRIDNKTRETLKQNVDLYGRTLVARGCGLSYNTVVSITETGVCTSTSFNKLLKYLNKQKTKYDLLIQNLEA